MYKLLYNVDLEKILKYLLTKDKKKIMSFFNSLNNCKDPLINAKNLIGHQPLYRYIVGNYRIICEILENNIVNILIIDIGHRKDIYRRL